MKAVTRIAVIGAGSWGTAIANLLSDNGHDVTLWGRDPDLIARIGSAKENPKYLKGLPLCPKLRASTNLEAVLQGASWVVCVVPTQRIRSVFSSVTRFLDGKMLVNASKGIEIGSEFRVSEIFQELAPTCHYAVLSGPNFAQEVTRRLPAAATIASTDRAIASDAQRLFASPYFRCYTSTDVVGVETAAALKNVIAIASGIVTGLELGYNAQAALINRGIVEMARLGKKLGASAVTFLGLAGMGDLVLTCTGPLSRNRRVGLLLGEGKALEAIQSDLGGVAEGVYTAQSARELAGKHGIEMPITEQVYEILYRQKSPRHAVHALMTRDLKEEWEA